MAVIGVEVTVDIICPYCYLGKKNLEKAMETHRAAHPDDEFEVTWKPFYLHNTLRKSGTYNGS